MSQLKLIVPMYVELPRKTKKNLNVWLNMNRFINLHFLVKNNAKKVFFEVMRDQLEGVKIDTPVNITYQLFSPDKRKRDKMNAIAVLYICNGNNVQLLFIALGVGMGRLPTLLLTPIWEPFLCSTEL